MVPIGPTSLLTVDLDVETKLPFPKPMVKKAIGDTLDYLAGNLKARAEQLAAIIAGDVSGMASPTRDPRSPRRERLPYLWTSLRTPNR